MCWIAPGPAISASVKTCFGAIFTEGETFQPCPRSRAALAPVPVVARPPCPLAPVKFSGLIDRDFARERRKRSPTPLVSPLNVPGGARLRGALARHGHQACGAQE